MEGQYSGVDILEALESAHNYNDYLTRLIRESTESKDLTDFGAGTGTFAKRLRDAGCRVLFILTPGGFEKLIMATSEPAKARTVPPRSDEMPDFAQLQKVVAQFGGEILF